MKANGTVAKDIALYFLDLTTDRYTPSIVAKTINQAKQLLEAGYTQEEITSVIDYVTTKTSIEMYSLGYVNATINDVLKKIKEEEEKQEIQKILEQAKLEQATTVEDRGDVDSESTERNRKKLERLNNKRKPQYDFSKLFNKE